MKLIPKLTLEHVHLNPYSIIKVHLAATQVLSLNNTLDNHYPHAAHATAEFYIFMDMFSICLFVLTSIKATQKMMMKDFFDLKMNSSHIEIIGRKILKIDLVICLIVFTRGYSYGGRHMKG